MREFNIYPCLVALLIQLQAHNFFSIFRFGFLSNLLFFFLLSSYFISKFFIQYYFFRSLLSLNWSSLCTLRKQDNFKQTTSRNNEHTKKIQNPNHMKKMELKAKSNKIVCKCCFKILYLNIHDEPKKKSYRTNRFEFL